MAKRQGGDNGGAKRNKKARYLPGGVKNVEPRYQGIYVSYTRGKENMCKNEVRSMMNEWCEKLYDTTTVEVADDEDDEEGGADDIEAAIAKEVASMKDTKKDLITPMALGCECMLFVRTRKPVEPVSFVKAICESVKETGVKSTRFTQRLTPVSLTSSASKPELEKLADIVLAPHFHAENQKPLKFAIRPTLRNFDGLTRDEVIKTVAERVGNEYGHSVDLKSYDKLILVDCFKSSIGMSVVDEFEELDRFNLEQLWQGHHGLKEEIKENNLKRVQEKKVQEQAANQEGNAESKLQDSKASVELEAAAKTEETAEDASGEKKAEEEAEKLDEEAEKSAEKSEDSALKSAGDKTE